jgi:hypothetical protein
VVKPGSEPGDDLLDSAAHELDSYAYQGGPGSL